MLGAYIREKVLPSRQICHIAWFYRNIKPYYSRLSTASFLTQQLLCYLQSFPKKGWEYFEIYLRCFAQILIHRSLLIFGRKYAIGITANSRVLSQCSLIISLFVEFIALILSFKRHFYWNNILLLDIAYLFLSCVNVDSINHLAQLWNAEFLFSLLLIEETFGRFDK